MPTKIYNSLKIAYQNNNCCVKCDSNQKTYNFASMNSTITKQTTRGAMYCLIIIYHFSLLDSFFRFLLL